MTSVAVGKSTSRGRWRIYWNCGGRKYMISAGTPIEVEAEQRRLEVALALITGDWPEWATALTAVRAYLGNGGGNGGGNGDAVAQYAADSLRPKVCGRWAATSLAQLRRLAEYVGGDILGTTPEQAVGFLAHVLGEGAAAETHNHHLATCSRFFAWAEQIGRVGSNPFAACKRAKVELSGEIVACSREERDRILDAAEGLPDGLAVWVATYAGLRRGEIHRLQWEHLVNDGRLLLVFKSKTGRPRRVPIADALRTRIGYDRTQSGYVIPWPRDYPAWSYAASDCLKALAERVPDLAHLCRWNVWRHTFASLLVQGGVGASKAASWMGNSEAVCRRHYAQFVSDEGDEAINVL